MNGDVTVAVFTQKSHGLDSEDDKRKEASSTTGSYMYMYSYSCMYSVVYPCIIGVSL